MKSTLSSLARLFNNECFVTKEKFREKGFVIHHLWYLKKGDVERKNYPKGNDGTRKYYADLENLVRNQLSKKEDEEFRKRIKNVRDEINKVFDEVLENKLARFVLIQNGIHSKLDHYKNGVCKLGMKKRIRFCVLALITTNSKKEMR